MPHPAFAGWGLRENILRRMKPHIYIDTAGAGNRGKRPKKKVMYSVSDLDAVARDLDRIARERLPDGLLQECLAGQEGSIRNLAIQIGIRWYIRLMDRPTTTTQWNPVKSMAVALRYAKLRHHKSVDHRFYNMEELTEHNGGSRPHPHVLPPEDWPEHSRLRAVFTAIDQALDLELITPANAAVARWLLSTGQSASRLAASLKVNRSSIYQHIGRIKQALGPILPDIEVQF